MSHKDYSMWLFHTCECVGASVYCPVNSHRDNSCSRLGEGIFTEGSRAIKYYWLAAGGSMNIIHVREREKSLRKAWEMT